MSEGQRPASNGHSWRSTGNDVPIIDQLERHAEATAHAARLVGEKRYHYYKRTRVARAMLAEIRRAKKRGGT